MIAALEAYTERPIAFGMDWGITAAGQSMLIEINDGYSYGKLWVAWDGACRHDRSAMARARWFARQWSWGLFFSINALSATRCIPKQLRVFYSLTTGSSSLERCNWNKRNIGSEICEALALVISSERSWSNCPWNIFSAWPPLKYLDPS